MTDERRRLDRTAWLTSVPLVALIVAEIATMADGRAGGTLSETVWWALGGRDRPWFWILSGVLLGLLAWMGLHFVTLGDGWGWRQLLVSVAVGMLAGVGLYLVR